jgi:hypothetical protein
MGGPCEVADFDDDGDVDLVDFAAFQRCFTGPSGVGDSLCRCLFDFDSNDSIDLADFDGFAARFSGPVVSATLVGKLYASDPEAQQQFGHSIAIGDNYAMVGVPRSGVGGAVYVYRRVGDTWVEQQKIVASDAQASDRFGQAVCLSGNLALIGADGSSDAGISSGAAYVFRREGSLWVEEAKLTASDAQAAAYFGWSVGLSGDYALVGAYADDGHGSDAGAVYVFVEDNGAWNETQKLVPDDIEPVDLFGWSLATSGDDYAVVGAVTEDAGGSADAGSAYVFFNNGGTWIQQAKLVAADADPGDMFGFSVSLSGDSVVIGALGDDCGGTDAGAAYTFFHDAGVWAQEAKLSGDLLASFDAFGASVSLDGAHAIVGAWKDDDDGSNSGSAFLFRRDGEDWRLKAKLTAPDAASSDRFGDAVAISGNEVFVGAQGDDDAGDSSGAVYILRFD